MWSHGQGAGATPALARLVPTIFHWSNVFSQRNPTLVGRPQHYLQDADLVCPCRDS
jgi:hypothetical protein